MVFMSRNCWKPSSVEVDIELSVTAHPEESMSHQTVEASAAQTDVGGDPSEYTKTSLGKLSKRSAREAEDSQDLRA
jgi:hypothetical protein